MSERGDMVQVHLLTAYPAALLNRDDAGLAKRLPFGGSIRTRVSSQCLKKHWRDSDLIAGLGDLAVRSRRIYQDLVAEPLQQDHGASPAEATAIAGYLLSKTLQAGKSDDASESKDEATKSKELATGQVVVLTSAECEFLVEKGVELLQACRAAGLSPADAKTLEAKLPLDKSAKSELQKLLKVLPASLDTALFGRMVTSDLFHRIDAAVSVAHAFTTHGEEAETDYFTAVDTLKDDDDDAGAGLIQDTELTSGVFYLYLVIDLNQLRANLVGLPETLVMTLARSLVEAAATVSPGAKRGSTAPYAYAEMVLLERGSAQPRTLANAFLDAVRAPGSNLLAASAQRLWDYRQRLAGMYGEPAGTSAVSTCHDLPGVAAVPLAVALDQVLGDDHA
ncbi:MAG: type I-E CRISPR-associated protein Cas7/Cse4/CasC [Fimbriimonadaceae bacterium]|nr:type I-E CRISPR-associated protein Cas7/Cse4/CasC [Fimbriimonadaceae bacterium]